MKRTVLTFGAVAIAVAASFALAQPGGWGYGPGPGCGNVAADGGCPMGPGQGRGQGMGPGAGYGMGMGMGPGAGGRGGAGAALLTPEERTAFRDTMHATKTVEACRAAVAEHRALIEQRAKEKGVTAPAGPRMDPCERMKARGLLS
jgi:hypothetical protein